MRTASEIVVEDTVEGVYTGRAADTSIATEAGDAAELHRKMWDAVARHFDANAEPKLTRLRSVRDQVIAT